MTYYFEFYTKKGAVEHKQFDAENEDAAFEKATQFLHKYSWYTDFSFDDERTE